MMMVVYVVMVMIMVHVMVMIMVVIVIVIVINCKDIIVHQGDWQHKKVSFSAVLIVDREKAELICSGVEFHSLCAKKACTYPHYTVVEGVRVAQVMR